MSLTDDQVSNLIKYIKGFKLQGVCAQLTNRY